MCKYVGHPDRHPDTGWPTIRLSCVNPDSAKEQSAVQFSPEMGSNLLSFQVEGTEYLYAIPEPDEKLKFLGTPVLYPTPNRVRNAQFTFGGHTFKFEPNIGPNFIHGLVRDVPWSSTPPVITPEGISVRTEIVFAPGKSIYDPFPFRNSLALTFALTEDMVRLAFEVHNGDQQPLPFGLAIHPYFRILGARESVRIQVPAQAWMEAIDLLPTGRLVGLDHGPADLRQPTSLALLDLDDVYWGMRPDKPTTIYYDALGKQVTLTASEFFSHAVVYTPKGKPYFCIENQSCSTDAHNLYARGFRREAHLTVLDPGATMSAWIDIKVSNQ
jgi:aldose 1-epimerase